MSYRYDETVRPDDIEYIERCYGLYRGLAVQHHKVAPLKPFNEAVIQLKTDCFWLKKTITLELWLEQAKRFDLDLEQAKDFFEKDGFNYVSRY